MRIYLAGLIFIQSVATATPLGLCHRLIEGSLAPDPLLAQHVSELETRKRAAAKSLTQTQAIAQPVIEAINKALAYGGTFEFGQRARTAAELDKMLKSWEQAVRGAKKDANNHDELMHSKIVAWLEGKPEYARIQKVSAAFAEFANQVKEVKSAIDTAKSAVSDAESARSWDLWTDDKPNADGSKSFGQLQNERANQATLYATQAVANAQMTVMNFNMQLPQALERLRTAVTSLNDSPSAQEALGVRAQMIAPASVNLVPQSTFWEFVAGTDGFFSELRQLEALSGASQKMDAMSAKFSELQKQIAATSGQVREELTAIQCAVKDQCLALVPPGHIEADVAGLKQKAADDTATAARHEGTLARGTRGTVWVMAAVVSLATAVGLWYIKSDMGATTPEQRPAYEDNRPLYPAPRGLLLTR